MGWNSRTNLRSVELITYRVVEICYQMEGWRRLLRHIENIEQERDAADHPLLRYQRRMPGDAWQEALTSDRLKPFASIFEVGVSSE